MNNMNVILNQIKLILDKTNYILEVIPTSYDWSITIKNPVIVRFSIVVYPDHWETIDALHPAYPLCHKYTDEIYSYIFLITLRLVYTNDILDYLGNQEVDAEELKGELI